MKVNGIQLGFGLSLYGQKQYSFEMKTTATKNITESLLMFSVDVYDLLANSFRHVKN